MALNLFQKYCPQFFDEVIGQDITVNALKKRARENNFPQVTRFIGYTGTGKTVLSRLISKSLLCKNKDENGNCCNKCNICDAINNEKILQNYFEINASNCGIDEIRNLEEQSNRKIMFADSSLKIFYIDEIQEMASKSKVALNNLLKLLERPSKNNYFILGSMDDYNIPEAVKNRCVTYKLKQIDTDKIADRLLYICQQEISGIEITEEKANVILSIAENSNGSMRTAISFLERVLDSNIWTEQQLFEELDIVTDKKLDEIVSGIFFGNFSILSIYINKDLIYKIINRIILLYKKILDIEMYKKDKYLIDKIRLPKLSIDILINMINKTLGILSVIYEKYYIQKEYLEFLMLQILNQNKKLNENMKTDKIYYSNPPEPPPKRIINEDIKLERISRK